MSAPPRGQPVSITMGAVWRFQLNPPPPRPQRLSVSATVLWVLVVLTRAIFGVVYFNDCPAQPNIPNYLLGLALTSVLMISFMKFPCEFESAQPHEQPRGCKACLMLLLSLVIFFWIIAGFVWVFSIYQPNYDPTAADGRYCNKTLYTFALWNMVWEISVLVAMIAKLCRGLLVYVVAQPVATDRGFYGQV